MSATLNLGTLDLSAYLRLGQGEGLDPVDAAFTEKVITTSLLREGGYFSLEQNKPKELIFPLWLKAASKDALHQLVQQINGALLINSQTVTFQDEGASQPTTFDLLTGQLDEDYDFRRGQHFYLAARLRLFVQPFGRTSASRVIATAAGTGALLTTALTTPTAIAGDVPAQLTAGLSFFRAFSYQSYFLAFSVLPDRYQAEFHAASMAAGVGTVVGGSGAVASVYRHLAFPAGAGTSFAMVGAATLPFASNYMGDNRVFALLRSNIPSLTLQQVSPFGLGATTTFFGSDWALIDLGILRVPKAAGGAALSPASMPLLGIAYSFPSNAAASRYLDVNELIVLPEDSTTFMNVTLNASVTGATFVFDGTVDEAWTQQPPRGQSQLQVTGGALRLNDRLRGAIPQFPPAVAGGTPLLAALIFPATVVANGANRPLALGVSARERTRYFF